MLVKKLLAIGISLSSTAWAVENINENSLLDSFQRGGSIMWVLLAVSILGFTFVIERSLALRKSVQIPKELLVNLRETLIKEGLESAKNIVKNNDSALGKVMFALLLRNGASRRDLEGVLEDEGGRIVFDLRRNLKPIGLVASLAPLLGLLGTVFGLISAFKAAATLGMDDPRNFAGGIYEALYTTAFGLVIAIPFLVIYNILRSKADSIVREVEDKALKFILGATKKNIPVSSIENKGTPEIIITQPQTSLE